jgi:hypothetical protein
MKHTAHIFSHPFFGHPSSVHFFGPPSFCPSLCPSLLYFTPACDATTQDCRLAQGSSLATHQIKHGRDSSTCPTAYPTSHPISHPIVAPVTYSEILAQQKEQAGFRLRIVPAFLCLFLVTTAHADTQIQEQKEHPEKARTKTFSYKPVPLEPAKPVAAGHVAERVTDRVTDMVNSVINIARDPRNPHNLAFNITNALANIVHIVLLAKENKSLRNKETDPSIRSLRDALGANGEEEDNGVNKINTQEAEEIALEIEQAVRAYLDNLDPQLKIQLVSLITRCLIIE